MSRAVPEMVRTARKGAPLPTLHFVSFTISNSAICSRGAMRPSFALAPAFAEWSPAARLRAAAAGTPPPCSACRTVSGDASAPSGARREHPLDRLQHAAVAPYGFTVFVLVGRALTKLSTAYER